MPVQAVLDEPADDRSEKSENGVIATSVSVVLNPLWSKGLEELIAAADRLLEVGSALAVLGSSLVESQDDLAEHAELWRRRVRAYRILVDRAHSSLGRQEAWWELPRAEDLFREVISDQKRAIEAAEAALTGDAEAPRLVLELGERGLAAAGGMQELIRKNIIKPTSEHAHTISQRWLEGLRVRVTAEEGFELEQAEESSPSSAREDES